MNTSPDRIESVPELIDALGGTTAFSRIIGKGTSTASEMKRSRSISVEYWPRVIEAAADRGIEGITAEFLLLLHSREKEGAQ